MYHSPVAYKRTHSSCHSSLMLLMLLYYGMDSMHVSIAAEWNCYFHYCELLDTTALLELGTQVFRYTRNNIC